MRAMGRATITRDGRTVCFHRTGSNDAGRCVVFVYPTPGSGAFDTVRPTWPHVAPTWLKEVTDDVVRARLDVMLERGRARRSTAELDVPLNIEAADIKAKTLLLYGYADTLVGPAHARWWKDNLANSRIEMMPGLGQVMVVPAWKRVLSHLAPGRGSAGRTD